MILHMTYIHSLLPHAAPPDYKRRLQPHSLLQRYQVDTRRTHRYIYMILTDDNAISLTDDIYIKWPTIKNITLIHFTIAIITTSAYRAKMPALLARGSD